MNNRHVFICDAVRTPIGRYGGALSGVRADDLAAIPISALMSRNAGLMANRIDEVILGCANQAGEDNRNVARMALLLAGLAETVPGVTVNRLCASGAEAVATAAAKIRAGQADVCIVGGVESMSRAPFVLSKSDQAFARGIGLEDTTIGWRFVNPRFHSAFGTHSMPETAENVADAYSVSRDDQDKFALTSQHRARNAQESGYFDEEIVPVAVTKKRLTEHVSTDEHPRGDTNLEDLSGLKPIVRPDGTVTAGNSSGVNDGAAALLIASEQAVERFGLKPRARFLGAAACGVAPKLMGIGPVPATQALCDRLGSKVSDYDIVEINEAFAAQVIASVRQLGLSESDPHINRFGGAIALGHPLGMTGARLIQTASHQLAAGYGRRALVTMCVGVGQGLSIALEAVT
jgi:3-oxoadipyl-CoA thiolase